MALKRYMGCLSLLTDMEFIAVFLVCFVILLILALALTFGKPPVYRPSRDHILEQIRKVEEGHMTNLDIEQWNVTVGIPIVHDPELEKIRQECQLLEWAAEQRDECSFSPGRFRFDERGMRQLESIRKALEKIIQEAPIYRSF
jgi:hypothetical protein